MYTLLYTIHYYAIRQKPHLPSEPDINRDGKIAVSKMVKICYNLYVAPKENYEETQHSHSILSKIDGTSAYIAISTQVIHLLEDMNP